MPDSTVMIQAWENDPGAGAAPEGGVLLLCPAPDLAQAPNATAIRVSGDPPRADKYPLDTPGFRYWTAAAALRRMADLWGVVAPNEKWHPEVGPVLPVILDEGRDLNAFYDRSALRFFHEKVGGRVVFSGESPDIVCHEAGHAALDGLRPQLFDVASLEAQAFHESFADIVALSSGLQSASFRERVLSETDGYLFRSSSLSRLAEQLGWGIRQFAPDAVDPDCLRNASNSLFYAPPDELPTQAPASELSSESHSLSRVFTAGYLRALAGSFESMATHTEADLLAASTQLLTLLTKAVKRAPIVPEYFSQVAAHLVHGAVVAGSPFADAIKAAMVNRGLLTVAGAVGVARSLPPVGMVAFAGASLPAHDLDASAYGLTVPSIRVRTASQPKAFGVAGAGRSVGDAATTSGEDAARAFVDDLIRRGRLDCNGFVAPGAAVVDPTSMKTHELVADGGDCVLKRRRIDCIPRRRA